MPSLPVKELLMIDPPPPDWLIKDILMKDSFVLLAGESGTGKSVLTYAMVLALVTGGRFLGTKVEQTRVIVFDEENSLPDLTQYLRWLWIGMGRPDAEAIGERFHLEHFSCGSLDGPPYGLMEDVVGQHKPALIVIDTATTCLGIMDENDNAEASRAIRKLRKVRKAADNNATLLVLKHAKMTGSKKRRSIRGARTWLGECDSALFLIGRQGPARPDGLKNTTLLAEKIRAHGLRHEIYIKPVKPSGDSLVLIRD